MVEMSRKGLKSLEASPARLEPLLIPLLPALHWLQLYHVIITIHEYFIVRIQFAYSTALGMPAPNYRPVRTHLVFLVDMGQIHFVINLTL